MDPMIIAAIAEVLKLTITGAIAYMKSKGATEEQIASMFTSVKEEMLKRDPADL